MDTMISPAGSLLSIKPSEQLPVESATGTSTGRRQPKSLASAGQPGRLVVTSSPLAPFIWFSLLLPYWPGLARPGLSLSAPGVRPRQVPGSSGGIYLGGPRPSCDRRADARQQHARPGSGTAR